MGENLSFALICAKTLRKALPDCHRAQSFVQEKRDMYRRGKLPVNRLMGERLQLADVNRGFDRLASGQAMRDVILF